jgi:hypothetical protein
MHAAEASRTVSANVNTAIAIRINRKFTDIVPVIPGRCTFSVEATRANRTATR